MSSTVSLLTWCLCSTLKASLGRTVKALEHRFEMFACSEVVGVSFNIGQSLRANLLEPVTLRLLSFFFPSFMTQNCFSKGLISLQGQSQVPSFSTITTLNSR